MPANEFTRLTWLRRVDILDTIEEQSYDDLTRIAAEVCGTPIALVSLIDEARQWFKSHHGLSARETPREFAFCSHAIMSDCLMEVPDSHVDPRFAQNPLVTGPLNVRYYAGAPLMIRPGIRLGTLCVIDHETRQLTSHQREVLEALARQVVAQIDLRLQIKEWEQISHAKDLLMETVTHDLRNPLSALQASLSMARDPGFADGQRDRLLDVAERSTERMLRLVGNILDHAQLTAGRVAAKPTPVSPSSLLAQAIADTDDVAAHRQVQVVVDHTIGSCEVLADTSRVAQVFTNLITNAAKFSPVGSTIELGATDEGDFVCFAVSDRGPGVPADDRERIFVRFEKVEHTKLLATKGTGLGLSICRQLIELHGGTIRCDGRPDGGSVFSFTLPKVLPN
jgi:signal transduction histidine kinase